MNKNRIRLTESQLHRVIKESVNKILSELDWRTYASAAEKKAERLPQGNDANSIEQYSNGLKPFQDAMKKAADNQYSKKRLYSPSDERFEEKFDVHPNVNMGHISYDAKAHDDDFDIPIRHKMKHFYGLGRNGEETESTDTYGTYKKPLEVSDAFSELSDYNKARKDFSDFYSGKSKYVKGKGWQ